MKKIWKWILVLAVLGIGLLVITGGAERIIRDVSFDWSNATEAERTVKAYADENGIRYSSYPASLIELLERNPQTREFVLEYPLYEPEAYDLAETDRSQGVPLLLQWDQRWGYVNYGSDMIAITGCGPTCVSMVGYYLTGDAEKFDPAAVAAFAEKEGYYAKGYGSSWTLISQGAVELGLDVTEIPLVEKRMKDNLEVGNPIICAMGPGDFTTGGHYIVIVGLENGLFRVNDPNSPENSQKLWSYEQIEGQIRNLWVIR